MWFHMIYLLIPRKNIKTVQSRIKIMHLGKVIPPSVAIDLANFHKPEDNTKQDRALPQKLISPHWIYVTINDHIFLQDSIIFVLPTDTTNHKTEILTNPVAVRIQITRQKSFRKFENRYRPPLKPSPTDISINSSNSPQTSKHCQPEANNALVKPKKNQISGSKLICIMSRTLTLIPSTFRDNCELIRNSQELESKSSYVYSLVEWSIFPLQLKVLPEESSISNYENPGPLNL